MKRHPLSATDSIVFKEDRVDHRISLASTGHRDVVATLTQGSARGRRDAVHVTGPVAEAAGSSDAKRAHEVWVLGLQPLIDAAGTQASAGRSNPAWTAKLTSFWQEVWVELEGRVIANDVRRGCRLEMRVHVGADGSGSAVEEMVLRPGDQLLFAGAFRAAFDRAEARNALRPPPRLGLATAVFAPGVAGVVVHELIGHALEGDVVARKESWLANGDLPLAERPVTVADDPRRGRGAWSIDDEGNVARETTLIERGRHVGVLFDDTTARALGGSSSGSGRRSSYLESVLPRMGCTYVEAGDDDPEEILRATREGLFIRRLATGHTNPRSGLASFVVTDADRIVDGRVAEPLDAFILELDGRESWKSIDRVAHDLTFDKCVGSCVRDGQPLAVSVGTPTIRIGVVRVRC